MADLRTKETCSKDHSQPSKHYKIEIFKTEDKNQSLARVGARSVGTRNSCQTERTPGKSGDKTAWKFNDENRYEFLDFYRFSTGEKSDVDLSRYTIKLTPKKSYEQIDNLFMQIGDQSMGAEKDGNSWVFNLSSNDDVKQYLKGKTSNNYENYRGVRTFTIFEYPNTKDENNYFGRNNVVISTGPAYYELGNKAKNIKLSTLPNWEDDYYEFNTVTTDDIPDGKVGVYVGGLAKKLLQQSEKGAINFIVDKKIDVSKKLPSQHILVIPDPVNKPNEGKIFVLGWNKSINVIGDKSQKALIDGTQQSTHTYEEDNFYQFFNGMLDIHSSFDSKKSGQFSTSIQGVTFLNPPTRNQGTVQANSNFFNFIDVNDWWTNDKNPKRRLKKAVNHFIKNDFFGKTLNEKPSTNLFDNQIVGGWLGASDGIESASVGLSSGRNFYHIADDSLKFLSKDQKFIENTVHQGAFGAPLSFAYGTGNGPSQNITVDGLYLHRVTQPDGIISPGVDEFGGLIMDWWKFKDYNQDPKTHKNGGYGKALFKNVYIPQVDQNEQIFANALHSMGYIGAQDKTTRSDVDADAGKYTAGGYTFKNSKSYINITTPLVAFTQNGAGNYHYPQSIDDGTQKEIIHRSSFPATSSQGTTVVKVYGASKDNISTSKGIKFAKWLNQNTSSVLSDEKKNPSNSQSSVYNKKSGVGVLARFLPDGETDQEGKGGAAATFLHKDIITPNQIYSVGANFQVQQRSQLLAIAKSPEHLGPNFVEARTKPNKNSNWDWGVFYPHDSNALDIRAIPYWDNKQDMVDGIHPDGFKAPGFYFPWNDDRREDFTNNDGTPQKGSGNNWLNIGNPYAHQSEKGRFGLGAGIHVKYNYDGAKYYKDQYFDWQSDYDSDWLEPDKFTGYFGEIDYNKHRDNDTWKSFVDTLTGAFLDKWNGKVGDKNNYRHQGYIDAATPWVNNPKDMINLQNSLYLNRSQYMTPLEAQVDSYWGWNEVPSANSYWNKKSNIKGSIITLPLDFKFEEFSSKSEEGKQLIKQIEQHINNYATNTTEDGTAFDLTYLINKKPIAFAQTLRLPYGDDLFEMSYVGNALPIEGGNFKINYDGILEIF